MMQCNACKALVRDLKDPGDTESTSLIVAKYIEAISYDVPHPTRHFEHCDYMRAHSALLRRVFFIYCVDSFLEDCDDFALIQDSENFTGNLKSWIGVTWDIFTGQVRDLHVAKVGPEDVQ